MYDILFLSLTLSRNRAEHSLGSTHRKPQRSQCLSTTSVRHTSEAFAQSTNTSTVLFKLKPGVSDEKLDELKSHAKAMVGKIPGLQRIDLNVPDPVSAARAKGYNMGLVAILDKPETIAVYAQHPAHMMYV